MIDGEQDVPDHHSDDAARPRKRWRRSTVPFVLPSTEEAIAVKEKRKMTIREVGTYHVGQHGWIEVRDSEGNCRWVEGEIISLIPTPQDEA